MPVMARRVGFARWRSDQPSGGNRYDEELSAGLRALGIDLREYAVSGPWPLPGRADVGRLLDLLPAERDWLVGNIVASAAPEALRAVRAAGGRVTLLMHYFPADDPDLSMPERRRLAAAEAEAVAVASTVVATSAWTADQVAARYGRRDALVALPGVDPAPLATGSTAAGGPPMLLWLARLTATKDPLTFVTALGGLPELPWTARLVGPDSVDADLARRVRDRLAETGLAGRVEVTGPRAGAALESIWADTDLLVHTSRSESYGMVVAEALARGIASVVASGTGAVEAQGVGGRFPPGDPDALADVLRGWLTDPGLQHRWREEAARLRGRQPTWRGTAEVVATALTG